MLSNIHQGGTLRWLAPELMQDSLTPLTWQADVYAFAISCVEVRYSFIVLWLLTVLIVWNFRRS